MIEAIRLGDQQPLAELYERHRAEFLHWASRRFQIPEDDLVDIYQEAMIALYRNIAKGKLANPRSSLKTYLFSIAKNLSLKHIRDHRMEANYELVEERLANEEDWSIEERHELTDRQQRIADALDQVGEPCKQIIRLFYFRNFAIEAIQHQLGYNTAEVVRSQKRRCMKYLKQVFSKE